MESLQQITDKLDSAVKKHWELEIELKSAWDAEPAPTKARIKDIFIELEDFCIEETILVKKQLEILKKFDK